MGPWGDNSAREGLASQPGPPEGEMSNSSADRSSKRKATGIIKHKIDDIKHTNEESKNLRRSTRIANGQEVIYTYHTEPSFHHLDVSKILIPRNHRQARNSEEWSYWQAAEDKKGQLYRNRRSIRRCQINRC
jgi:hypothetical protein